MGDSVLFAVESGEKKNASGGEPVPKAFFFRKIGVAHRSRESSMFYETPFCGGSASRSAFKNASECAKCSVGDVMVGDLRSEDPTRHLRQIRFVGFSE